METVLIRVVDDGDGSYNVELLVDAGGEEWAPELLTSEPLAADLEPASAPDVLGAGPLDKLVVEFLRTNEQTSAFGPIGEWLAGLVLRGTVADAWETQVRAGNVTRTLFEVGPAPLRLLPWELMRRNELRLFTEDAHPFVRALPLDSDPTEELVPLRLLVVEGSPDDALGTALEVGGITAALPAFGGRVEMWVLHEPSPKQLEDALRKRPHVLHFVGHGFVDSYSKQPALRVGDWPLTRDYILGVMPHVPRLAVLNACRTGEGDVSQVQALTGAFLQRKAAAVIGMQGDVRGKSAARFGVELYQALARGKLIDEAVAVARRAVYGEVGVVGQQRDWCLPSLTLRLRPEEVLPVTCGCRLTDADFERIGTHLFEPTKLFVDRVEERWELASDVDPDAGAPRRLVLVLGGIQIGKTWLVQWVRTRCALRGRRVRYIDFRGPRSLGFLQALHLIRETAEDVASLAPPKGAYDRFDYDLAFLLQGKLPPEPEPGGPLSAQKPAIPDELSLGENIVDRIFDSFRLALERETNHDPLLLIFDHVGALFRHDFLDRLYPLLIKKVADGDVPNVRILVVLSAEQRRDYWPPDEAKVWGEHKIDTIKPELFPDLARELLYLMGTEVNKDHVALIEAWHRLKIKDGWSPTELRVVLDAGSG